MHSKAPLPMCYNSSLSVHTSACVMKHIDENWNKGISSFLSRCGLEACLSTWGKIMSYHGAFVEIAYEVPEEIPYTDGTGEIEEFLNRFRFIIENADITAPNTQKDEKMWLLSVMGKTDEATAGVSMGARLVMLTEGIKKNIDVDNKKMVDACRETPYSFVCSGKLRQMHIDGEVF